MSAKLRKEVFFKNLIQHPNVNRHNFKKLVECVCENFASQSTWPILGVTQSCSCVWRIEII